LLQSRSEGRQAAELDLVDEVESGLLAVDVVPFDAGVHEADLSRRIDEKWKEVW
jgi:hypothetical protein